jgi:hypothetical protein
MFWNFNMICILISQSEYELSTINYRTWSKWFNSTGEGFPLPLDRSQIKTSCVGFQGLTTVAVKNYIFWNITLCSPVRINRRFGGTYRLHLQSRRINQTGFQHEAGRKQLCFCLLHSGYLTGLPFDISQKRRLTFIGLHDIIFQKIETQRGYRPLLSEYIRRLFLPFMKNG